MECCQVVRSASRGIRPSLLQGQIVRQQQHFQSSSSSSSPSWSRPPQSNPNRSAVNDLLGSSSDKSSPVSRPSILSRPRGTGLAGMLPPRPPRVDSSSSTFNTFNAFAIPSAVSSLAGQIQRDAAKSAAQNGIGSSFAAFKLEDFKQNFSMDKVQNIRLSPSVGRLVHVTPKTPVPIAFEKVNKLAFRNGLKNMSFAQRAHERKALRRKRKLREAWRSRFKIGFKAAVNRAMELRKQGW